MIRDHHPGYISWDEYERNQRMLSENAHMQKRAARKSGRGGRALLTGIARCGRCGRILHVFYGMAAGHAHRYQCRGDVMRGADRCCVGIGGVRVDRAVSTELLRAVAPHALEAALEAAERASRAVEDVLGAVRRELEEARYETALAGRRHAAVDPDKRLVARELESRWEAALERERVLRDKVSTLEQQAASRPSVDRERLMNLARDLPAVWNALRPTCA